MLTSIPAYENISPPFTLKFREMSRQELKAYFEWFLDVLPGRIEMLTRAVQSTPGFADWKADRSPDSLSPLGAWLMQNIETRLQSAEEKEDIYEEAPAWFRAVDIGDFELTNRSFSLAIDVGMYLSEVFLSNHQNLRWKHFFGRKNDIDHGQPVISGFGAVDFNPVRMMVTLAYGLADNTYDEGRLRELYDIWARMIPSS